MKTKVLFLSLLLLLVGCGYKPVAKVAKNVFHEHVYVEVKVDRVRPENAPFVKDAIKRMFITRLGNKVVPKSQAKSEIIVKYSGNSIQPIAYANGYISRYRASVRTRFIMKTKTGTLRKNITEVFDSDVGVSSFDMATLETEAIRKGLEKSVDSFLAYIATVGIQVEQKKEARREERRRNKKAKTKL